MKSRKSSSGHASSGIITLFEGPGGIQLDTGTKWWNLTKYSRLFGLAAASRGYNRIWTTHINGGRSFMIRTLFSVLRGSWGTWSRWCSRYLAHVVSQGKWCMSDYLHSEIIDFLCCSIWVFKLVWLDLPVSSQLLLWLHQLASLELEEYSWQQTNCSDNTLWQKSLHKLGRTSTQVG